jgi:transposase
MPTTYEIGAADAAKVREAMKETKNKHAYRRLEVIALRGEGWSNAEIAEMTKYHMKRVSQIASLYCNEGIEAVASDGRKGGNHRNMTFAEEEEFLETFLGDAESGHILTIEQIADAYAKASRKETVVLSTVYRMLKRHGWRKLAPRSAHPKKASDEAIEASKKLKLAMEN